MNKRSIIIGICTIAVTACALGFGGTSRFGPLITVQSHGSPDRTALVPGNRSITSGSLNQQKELNVDTPKQAEVKVPDYVVYGQLFRAVALLKQKAEAEEKQGKLGSGYARVVQTTLKLDDAASKELDDVSLAWDGEKESLTSEAEAIITRYQAERSKAVAEGKEPPAEPGADLQQLYERLNGTILDARDRLKQRLGERAFDSFETAVQENITANIKSTPVDLKNPNLQRSDARVPHLDLKNPMIPPVKEREGSTSSLQSDRPQINEQSSTMSQDVAGTANAKKSSKLSIGDMQRRPSSALGQAPQPQFNFCFFGGIVFYGTYLWLVPQVDQVLQLSFTQLDFCAGLTYDPYVYGALFFGSNFIFAEDHESFGRSFFRPAIILNHAPAFPSTLYSAYAEHWIIRCGIEIGCDWFFVDAYWVQGVTPSCVAGSTMSPNFNTCPGPSPSPTPTPTVKIDSVGFAGDFLLRKWDKEVRNRRRIDFPDGTEATWRKGNNPKSAVAYLKGTSPRMFATFVVTPTQSVARPAQVRVKLGNNIVATKNDVPIGGGNTEVRDIVVTFSGLESEEVVKASKYDFTWEVSFDGGTNWANAGKSGAHHIYWLWDNPKNDTFKNRANAKCFDTSDVLNECDTLYDEAVKRATEAVKPGTITVGGIASAVNKAVSNSFAYNPCSPDPVGHPLGMVDSSPAQGVCSANANLLRGLLRSIGIDAKTNYYWGGNNSSKESYFYKYRNSDTGTVDVTFRVKRRANNDGANNPFAERCTDVEVDPHFSFHALVAVPQAFPLPGGGEEIRDVLYDPSYGLEKDRAQVTALEVSKWPSGGFFQDNDVPSNRLVKNDDAVFDQPGFKIETNTTCDHRPQRGVLFPNPIDEAQFFVGQHYFDFLNREADPGGLAFWTGQITQCNGDPACIDSRRVGVSLAFFQSIEFQVRGYFVQRFYRASYARHPQFGEFLRDVGRISTNSQSAEDLETNKQNFADEFVETEAFKAQYPFTMEHAAYVDALFANAGITPSPEERAALISGLEQDTENRATVLRRVVDNPAFINAEFNRAFILMCYFGYLRRDPDTDGYNFWLGILNNENDLGHITRAFIVSTEYRYRFGLP